MPPFSHRTELKVGLFLVVGAVLVGGLILRFNGKQVGSEGGYLITVEVKDGKIVSGKEHFFDLYNWDAFWA